MKTIHTKPIARVAQVRALHRAIMGFPLLLASLLLLLLILVSCNDDDTSPGAVRDPSLPVHLDTFMPDSGGIRTKFIVKGFNLGVGYIEDTDSHFVGRTCGHCLGG